MADRVRAGTGDLLRSIARSRLFGYFWWANIAALLFAIGPAVLAGLRRWLPARRTLPAAATLLIGAALSAILIADASGLSKAEEERIWLPFGSWLTIAAALPPDRHRRG